MATTNYDDIDIEIVECDIVIPSSPSCVECDVRVPIETIEKKPNVVTIGTPVVSNIKSKSVDVKIEYSCSVDFFGGVEMSSCDTFYSKNPSSIQKTIVGLTPNTDYTVKGVALAIYGEMQSGKSVSFHTRDSLTPEGYARLEYIESTGTQYIDTGVLYYDWEYNNYLITSDIYISQKQANSYFGVNGQLQVDVGGLNGYVNNRIEVIQTAVANSNCTVKVGNNIISTYNYGSSYGIGKSYQHFKLGDHSAYARYRLYGSTIILNNEIVRNLVPMMRLSDSKPGLYDLVNDVFYVNEGTGEFLYGNIIATEDEITKVEYIQSNGTQFFNIEYNSDINSKSVITASSPNVSSTAGSFGQATSSGRFGFCFAYNGQMVCYVNNNYYTGTGLTMAANTKYTMTMDMPNRTLSNGVGTYAMAEITLPPNSQTYCIGAAYIGSTYTEKFTGNIYDVKLYTSNTLKYDLIPSKIGTIAGMWDKLSGKFYKSISGTNFIAGSEI